MSGHHEISDHREGRAKWRRDPGLATGPCGAHKAVTEGQPSPWCCLRTKKGLSNSGPTMTPQALSEEAHQPQIPSTGKDGPAPLLGSLVNDSENGWTVGSSLGRFNEDCYTSGVTLTDS